MRLVCCHCERYDAEPLNRIPPTWTDVQPSKGAITSSTVLLITGKTADHFGECPDCLLGRTKEALDNALSAVEQATNTQRGLFSC
jgi:hypothetical protein